METQKNKSLFNPGGCLNASTFKKYLGNELSISGKKKVEEHLRNCLICSEAMEGYRKQHQSAVILQNDIDWLSTRIRKRYAHKGLKKAEIPVYIVVSLFIFLILIVIIYYIIRYLLLNP